MSKQELMSMLFLLLAAGHETTVNLLGNGILALLTNPEQMAALRRDSPLIPAAVEEFLRYDTPVTTGTFRFAREDVEIGGVTIPADGVMLLALGSACRDPKRFSEPDRLDITRDSIGHLGFGHGIHYCLGAPLARLEATIAFETLLRRLPDLRLAVAPEQLRWQPSMTFRGLLELPVRFTPDPLSRAPQDTDERFLAATAP